MRALAAVAISIGCVLFIAMPAAAQPQGIDFSITKTLLPDGARLCSGELVTFRITGTMPPPSPITGTILTYTLPGHVVMTDTLPSGIDLKGWVSPPNWECFPLTTTLPITDTLSALQQLKCTSGSNLVISNTQHFPLLVTTTIGTPVSRMLINAAEIGAAPDVITNTMPPDPNPGNNRVEVQFEVCPEEAAPPPKPVPTLGHWGALTFSILMGLVVVYKLRKKRFS